LNFLATADRTVNVWWGIIVANLEVSLSLSFNLRGDNLRGEDFCDVEGCGAFGGTGPVRVQGTNTGFAGDKLLI
jgi:hypothetical protein